MAEVRWPTAQSNMAFTIHHVPPPIMVVSKVPHHAVILTKQHKGRQMFWRLVSTLGRRHACATAHKGRLT